MPDKEYTLEASKREEPTTEPGNELPIYYERLKLSEDQKSRISREIEKELEFIKSERDAEKLEQKWDELDNQYHGKVNEDARRMFNLCRKVTKVKVNKIVNKIMKAFMQSDPKYAVTPRPEFMRQGGSDVCDRQSDFLDYKLDNLPFRKPEALTAQSAVLKGTGILKIFHLIKREKRKREESYQGTPKIVVDPNSGQPVIDPNTGQPVIRNKGLEEFLRNWPDAAKDYPGYAERLAKGEKVNFVAQYTETTYNDPAFKNVDLKNFFVRKDVDGYEGLKATRMHAERQEYTYWELKREEKRGMFEDVDELIYADKEKTKKVEDYDQAPFVIFETVIYTKLEEKDDEEVKIVVWWAEEKKKIIGSIMYPYYAIDCYYVPHYISDKNAGFYQPGVGEDMTDSNIAENAILNHILEAAWMRNLITPITQEGSDIQKQFLEKTWAHGIPLIKGPGEEIDFLQKYMPQVDIGGLIQLTQYLIQGDDDITGVSSLMSGRESPIDPTAPAQKTMALLAESGESIEEYIIAMSPAFNITGEILLQMYFQMETDGVKYAPKPERVVGKNPFAEMSRADMAAKTNLSVTAARFAFDRLEENKKDMALLQMGRQDPFFARYPDAIYTLWKNVIKGWSPKWAALVDQVMPTQQKFQKDQMNVAIQAVTAYVQNIVAQAKLTNTPPEIDPRQLLAVIQQMTQEAVTPPPPEVQKEREKASGQPV